MKRAFPVMSRASKRTGLRIAIRVFRSVDGVDVEDGEFGGAGFRAEFYDGNAAFGVPVYGAEGDFVGDVEVAPDEAAYAVDFAAAFGAAGVVEVGGEGEVDVVQRALIMGSSFFFW